MSSSKRLGAVKIRFEPRRDEFIEGRLAEFRVRRRTTWMFCWVWGPATVAAGAAMLVARSDHPIGYLVAAVGVATLLYVMLFIRLLADAEWRAVRDVRIPVDLRLDHGTLLIDTLLGKRSVDVSEVNSLIDVAHVFVLCHRDGSEIIPKRAFPHPEDVEEFRRRIGREGASSGTMLGLVLPGLAALAAIAATASADSRSAVEPRTPSEIVGNASTFDRQRVIVGGDVVVRNAWTSPLGTKYLLTNVRDEKTTLQLVDRSGRGCGLGTAATTSGTFHRFYVIEGRSFYNIVLVETMKCAAELPAMPRGKE